VSPFPFREHRFEYPINDFSVSIHRFVISMSCRVDMVTVIESGSNSEMSGAIAKIDPSEDYNGHMERNRVEIRMLVLVIHTE